jgi:hypothetical protein
MACLTNFTMADCLATISGLDCSTVQGESGKLHQCESEFLGASCKQRVGADGTMPGLPLSCKGVFLF